MSLTPSERNLADAYEKCLGNPMSGASQTPGVAVQSPTPPGLTKGEATSDASLAELKKAVANLLPHLATESEMLDYASLNDGRAAEGDGAAVWFRKAWEWFVAPKAPPELKGAREWKLSFDHYHAFNPSVDGPCGDHGESVTVREVLPPESPTQLADVVAQVHGHRPESPTAHQVPEGSPVHNGWIGVDFDATLSHYTGWKGHEFDHMGPPIPAMMERVKAWIAEGRTVKIFTARAGIAEQIPAVREWLTAHDIGQLEITNVKDRYMHELWDDRAVQVEPNTGRRMDCAGATPVSLVSPAPPPLTYTRVEVREGYPEAGKRGVVFSQPQAGEAMATVLMDGEAAPDLWAWRVLKILGPDTRKPAQPIPPEKDRRAYEAD